MNRRGREIKRKEFVSYFTPVQQFRDRVTQNQLFMSNKRKQYLNENHLDE